MAGVERIAANGFNSTDEMASIPNNRINQFAGEQFNGYSYATAAVTLLSTVKL